VPFACTRDEPARSAPVATKVASAASPAVAPTANKPPAPASAPTAKGPAAASSPAPINVASIPINSDLNDFSDSADFEWNLEDEADTEDFEIDADATSYFMPPHNTVTFKAKALNGTPPFTFTWNFNDGSPTVTGEMVKHTFLVLGDRDVVVVGKDASGATSNVNLGIGVVPVQNYADTMRIDDASVAAYRAKFPDIGPDPTATP